MPNIIERLRDGLVVAPMYSGNGLTVDFPATIVLMQEAAVELERWVSWSKASETELSETRDALAAAIVQLDEYRTALRAIAGTPKIPLADVATEATFLALNACVKIASKVLADEAEDTRK